MSRNDGKKQGHVESLGGVTVQKNPRDPMAPRRHYRSNAENQVRSAFTTKKPEVKNVVIIPGATIVATF